MPNGIRIENSLHILDISKLAGSKLTDFVFVYFYFNIPPYKTERFGCENVWHEETIELT